jgi:hypothetical protein
MGAADITNSSDKKTSEEKEEYFSSEYGISLDSLVGPQSGRDTDIGEGRMWSEMKQAPMRPVGADAGDANLQDLGSSDIVFVDPEKSNPITLDSLMNPIDTSAVDLDTTESDNLKDWSEGLGYASAGVGILGGGVSLAGAGSPAGAGVGAGLGMLSGGLGLAATITGSSAAKTQEKEQEKYEIDVAAVQKEARKKVYEEVKSGKNKDYFMMDNGAIVRKKNAISLSGYSGGASKSKSGVS